MEKSYNPKEIEQRLYKSWENSGYFKPSGLEKNSYCIMLPPPNVTGSLHMGHAFQDTLMDSLIRFNRMNDRNVLWQCGCDHAGIATQIVVERQLELSGKSRHEIGRDAFMQEAWDWKEQSGGTISQQLRRMGSSMDWSRERFTLDDQLSASVREVFVRLFREGLIYRGKRLVNWDPVLKTAISDLEVISEQENGHLWHLRYPLENGKGYLIVATTRPETMLGDSAVAVHPKDERYKHLIGEKISLPLSDRMIPIIADDYVDPEFGSGCVKITPAHDFNDYQVGQRHNLQVINIFSEEASLNKNVPNRFQELDRFEARDVVIEELSKLNLMEKIENHTLMVPRGDRTQSIIEPYLTDQWFVKAEELAVPAIEAVKNGSVKFIPENWSKTYFEWMNNIEDWCISRQLWWGHRIPAWYDDEGNVFVGYNEADARENAGISPDTKLLQDPDVLDTWFSSALWPFSTLGWPKKTKELQAFYPTNALVTGFDIIFFWVARMIMMGIKFTGDVPFKEVYIHGLVRDSKGNKMSKSKGNIIDPIDLIDGIGIESLVQKRGIGLLRPEDADRIEQETRREFPKGIPGYGTDALRFTFAIMATQGRDIRFDLGRINGYRNFCNKIWNAARFVFAAIESHQSKSSFHKTVKGLPEEWICARFNDAIVKVRKGFKDYRFDRAAQALYEFVWDDYCDWYIEVAKVTLYSTDASQAEKDGVCDTLISLLDNFLRALHPFMPFITEEIWQKIPNNSAEGSLMLQSYPVEADTQPVALEESNFEVLKEIILGIRRIRAEYDIEPKKTLPIFIKNATEKDKKLVCTHSKIIMQLARAGEPSFDNYPNNEVATSLAENMTICIPFEGLIDKAAESARLSKELAKAIDEADRTANKLKNKSFVEKAPKEVVEQVNLRLEKAKDAVVKLREQIEAL